MRRLSSPNGRRFISLEEGRARWDSIKKCYFPYKDPIGKWTIGVGHLCSASEYATYQEGIDDIHVDLLLTGDLDEVDYAIERDIKWPRPRTQNEHDALASWLFNVGIGWLARPGGSPRSGVVRCIEARKYEAVPTALAMYDVADGQHREYLHARRLREGKLFLLHDEADQTDVQRLSLVAAELKYEAERARALSFGRLDLLSEDDIG